MKDGKKYAVHQKGDRIIISVSLPLSLDKNLEELCITYNKTRSEIMTIALSSFCKALELKVGEI